MGSMPELPADTTEPTSPETSPTEPETSSTQATTQSTQPTTQTTQSTPSVEPPVDDSEVTSFINILFLFITYILI